MVQKQVYHTPIFDVNYLKQHLLDLWAAVDQKIIYYFVHLNLNFKHSYLFIYWSKCYGMLQLYCWLNSLNIWKALVWY